MEIEVETPSRVDLVDVTARVADAVPGDLDAGTCSVFVPHTTAGILINEDDPRLRADLLGLLERLVPPDDGYGHDAIDDNAAAHLRAVLVGPSVTVPVRDGGLALGSWQSILLAEGDGPRTRRLVVTVTRTSGT